MALRSILVGSTIIAWSISALGQAVPQTDWVIVARELGSFGLVAFIVYWVFTKTLPKMSADHRDAIKDIVNESKQNRELFECHIGELWKNLRIVDMEKRDKQK